MPFGVAQLRHPSWCNEPDGPCGDHLSAPITVPAQAGLWYAGRDGLVVPRVEIAAAMTRCQARGVYIGLPDLVTDRWVSAIGRPDEARAMAAALTAQADLAESRWDWR
jgi:hypothetical protein